jgi:hypothetical protein
MVPRTVLHSHMSRRSLLTGVGAAAVAGLHASPVGAPRVEAATPAVDPFPGKPAPRPIPHLINASEGLPQPFPDPFNFIHWLLPGPAGAATPILQLPAFGLDVDPSTITDFDGFVAYAVVAGNAQDADGNPLDVEFDVRVMEGTYVGSDGQQHHGTFGFF